MIEYFISFTIKKKLHTGHEEVGYGCLTIQGEYGESADDVITQAYSSITSKFDVVKSMVYITTFNKV